VNTSPRFSMASVTQARERAEANFKKAQAKHVADSEVMSGIAAEAKAVDEKTAKLRALRRARDAAAQAGKAPTKLAGKRRERA